jgi:hypothetical protein
MTEQASKGQIGQPAATMMENKKNPPARRLQMRGDYPLSPPSARALFLCRQGRTDSVDNFVINLLRNSSGPAWGGLSARSTEF